MYKLNDYEMKDGRWQKVDLPDKDGCAKYDYKKGTNVEVKLFASNDGSPPTMVIPEYDMYITDFRTCPDRVRLRYFLSDLFYTSLYFSVNIFYLYQTS